jgi:hypothetical protein
VKHLLFTTGSIFRHPMHRYAGATCPQKQSVFWATLGVSLVGYSAQCLHLPLVISGGSGFCSESQVEYLQCSSEAAALEFMGPAHHVRLTSLPIFAFEFFLRRCLTIDSECILAVFCVPLLQPTLITRFFLIPQSSFSMIK